MIRLNDRELDMLKTQLRRISEESRKKDQRKHTIYNMARTASLLINKAERRQKQTLDF